MVVIHLPFVVIYVVAKCYMPTCLFEADPHKTNTSEEFGDGSVLFVHFCLRELLRRFCAAFKLEVIREVTVSGNASAWLQIRRTRQHRLRSRRVTRRSRAILL